MMLMVNKTKMHRLCKDFFPSIPGIRSVVFTKICRSRHWLLRFTLPNGEYRLFGLFCCDGRAVLSHSWDDAEGAFHYESHTLSLETLLLLGLVDGVPTPHETEDAQDVTSEAPDALQDEEEGLSMIFKPDKRVKFWHVTLPASEMWLASDDPNGDLVALGYDAFALTQVVVMGSYDMPLMNLVPETAQGAPHEAQGIEQPQDPTPNSQDILQSDEQPQGSSLIPPAPKMALVASEALLFPAAVELISLASGVGAYLSGPDPFTVTPRGGQAAPAATLRRTKEAGRVGSAVGGASPASAPYGGGAPPGRAAQSLPAWYQAGPSRARAQRQP